MYSELECGVCYRRFNCGRRCPRELECRHVFCQSCLLLLAHTRQEPDETTGCQICCPLCRHITSISGKAPVEGLQVTQSVLDVLLAEGGLEEEDPEEEEHGGKEVEPETDHSDSNVGTRGGRLRRSFRKVWMKIIGKREGEDTLSDSDIRSLALMSCYML
ncbi:E3 ubiquitin-protein ligase-like [Synchiropus splendidus]|uniref:E3 ubiquitin-protein ligase-like n=1 Tax=Synchiropus splendidus TaxID=270530 RepID=UPI00237DEA5A|nr:E3 ubiquitin-protein ligase-like [Synchiropus splendidus]